MPLSMHLPVWNRVWGAFELRNLVHAHAYALLNWSVPLLSAVAEAIPLPMPVPVWSRVWRF